MFFLGKENSKRNFNSCLKEKSFEKSLEKLHYASIKLVHHFRARLEKNPLSKKSLTGSVKLKSNQKSDDGKIGNEGLGKKYIEVYLCK